MTPAAIMADKELTEYAKRSGKVLFGDNCAPCHGTNGVGAKDKDGLFAPVLTTMTGCMVARWPTSTPVSAVDARA